jgi:hypothetical protein
MSRQATELQEERILVLAPQGRDAPLICETLRQHGLNCTVCAEADLQTQLLLGVAALLLSKAGWTSPCRLKRRAKSWHTVRRPGRRNLGSTWSAYGWKQA